MEASYEGGQSPERAVAPYMEWNIKLDQVLSIKLELKKVKLDKQKNTMSL